MTTDRDTLRKALEYGERWMRHDIEDTEWCKGSESAHAKAKAELAHVRSVIEALAAQPEQPVAWRVGLELFGSPEEAQRNVRNPDLKPEPLFASPQVRAEPTDEQIITALAAADMGWRGEEGEVIPFYNDGDCDKEIAAVRAWLKHGWQVRAEQTAVPQWISVDERLPELHVTVALLDTRRWMNTGSEEFGANWHGAGYLSEFGRKYWSVFGEGRSISLDAVTHWMALPQPPQENQ
jgi:hypothetical protein